MFNNDETCFENIFSYPEPKDLNMYYCGKRIKTPNHSYGPEVREHFLIVYIKEGTGTLLSSREKIPLVPGSILVMFPNEKIHYIVEKKSLWSISWVGIYGNLVYGFFDKLGITPEKPVFRPENPGRIESIFEEIYNNSFSDTPDDRLKMIGLLYEFFFCIMSEGRIKTNKNYINEILNIIEYNYDKNISIESLAKSVFVNPSYLSRIFKEEKGITLKEYIINKKIERVKELLINDRVSIKMAANSVGITDSLYFSRIFKKKTGMSPSEYRMRFK